MANEVASSDLVDPFANCSMLSLFPRTFGASADHRHASKDTDTIDSRHTLLKSMLLRSPQKLLEQAKMVLNSNLPELPQRNISHAGADAAAAEKIVRGRRPGLGIKRDRPRISFLPTLSQDTLRSETTDFDKLAMELEKLDDPEEYFLAHKRLEIAKKEYERLGSDGGSKQSLPPNAPLPRQRRQGLLGSRRATGRFKQFFSQSRPEIDEAFISSQEIASLEISSQEMLSQDVPSSSNNISARASFEREILDSGPVSRTEDKVNKLLNEFLSKNPEELEGDKAIALLHECLQIKPISTDKQSLPDLPDIPMPDLHDIRNDFKVSGGNLFHSRNSLVNAHAKLKGMSIPTLKKQRDSTVCNADFTDSPTPPRNPFEAISSLKRRNSQISHSLVKNPSLVGSTRIHSDKVEMEKIISPNLESQSSPSIKQALDIATDLSPARNPSRVGSIHLQSDKVELEKNLLSSNLESLLQAYDSRDCTTGSGEVLADYSTSPVDKYVNEYSSLSGVREDDHSSEFDVCVNANPGCTNEDEMIVDDETRLLFSHSNKLTDPLCEVDNSAGGILEEPVAPAQPVAHSEHPILDQQSNNSHKSDPQNPGSVEQIAKNANSKNSDANLEQPIENIHERSGALIDQNLATRTNKNRKRKEITRRQSLAAAGTKWESGLRRSTRIKMRPLEYWKGERFLYGRIHSSLATVIGVKYSSPAAGDKNRSLKVKSYVSDEYKELVDLAALH